MLWPRVVLPKVTVKVAYTWYQDLFRTMQDTDVPTAEIMWRRCNQILKASFAIAQVPPLFPRASRSWECFTLNLTHETYVVQDLGDLSPKPTSVLLVDSERVRLEPHIIQSGLPPVATPEDPDEFLYMAGPEVHGSGPA